MTALETVKTWNIDHNWALFLDRDGVINTRLVDDYVKTWSEFVFVDGVLEFLARAASHFGHIFVVTNQQGIGKGLYTESDFLDITDQMLKEVALFGGFIDRVYWCPHLKSDACDCRKPAIRNALKAVEDFPTISLTKAIMVGDSISDMQFGKASGMKTVGIGSDSGPADIIVKRLSDFGRLLGFTPHSSVEQGTRI
jgi:D-glycero-D-manno-heptose 1,7-bisphosphate phosphatase